MMVVTNAKKLFFATSTSVQLIISVMLHLDILSNPDPFRMIHVDLVEVSNE